MTTLLILWAGLTSILVVLLIIRSSLSMREDDQLFLDPASSHLAKEQEEVMAKMAKLQPWVQVCGAGSAVLMLVIAGMALYGYANR